MRRTVFCGFLVLGFLSSSPGASAQMGTTTLDRSLATATENVPSAPLAQSWLCTAKAFTKNFEALGSSRAEARINVSNLCKAEYNEMHCKTLNCEGPDSGQPLGWTCKLSPFGKSFESVAATRAEAKIKCQKLCRVEYAEMFCEAPTCNEG